jgi:hypothetical protein
VNELNGENAVNILVEAIERVNLKKKKVFFILNKISDTQTTLI